MSGYAHEIMQVGEEIGDLEDKISYLEQVLELDVAYVSLECMVSFHVDVAVIEPIVLAEVQRSKNELEQARKRLRELAEKQ